MPLYLFDKRFVERSPRLAQDFTVPPYFSEDLFSVLGEKHRPDYRWLVLGPSRSGSSFHVDPNATSAWNAVVSGSKKWVLFPPSAIPPGVHASADGADVATSVSLTEWFINFYPDIKEGMTEVKPIECTVKAGEMLFIPRGWWHLAINLEPGVAITQVGEDFASGEKGCKGCTFPPPLMLVSLDNMMTLIPAYLSAS